MCKFRVLVGSGHEYHSSKNSPSPLRALQLLWSLADIVMNIIRQQLSPLILRNHGPLNLYKDLYAFSAVTILAKWLVFTLTMKQCKGTNRY